MKIKKSAHAAYRVQYYIVWSTRFKRKILVEGVKSYLLYLDRGATKIDFENDGRPTSDEEYNNLHSILWKELEDIVRQKLIEIIDKIGDWDDNQLQAFYEATQN